MLFRVAFIKIYNPYPSLKGRGKALWECFRFGFWWGMDFNAYVFLVSMVLISIPSIFLISFESMVLSCAFFGMPVWPDLVYGVCGQDDFLPSFP